MICKKIKREDWGRDLQWYAYTRFYFTTEYGWNYIPLDLLAYFPLLIANTVILFLVILLFLIPLIINTVLLGCPLTILTALKYDSVSGLFISSYHCLLFFLSDWLLFFFSSLFSSLSLSPTRSFWVYLFY